jgi:cob(I)alamin adenosyltransferase
MYVPSVTPLPQGTDRPRCQGSLNPRVKIYTRRGDEGQTDLRDMSRVSKASPRIEAYGNVDEVNSLVGRVRPTGYDDVDEWLRGIQNHLHIIQADFANPDSEEGDPQLRAEHTAQLEEWIDTADEELEPLSSFILPGGADNGARLHHARAVCRRAERRAVVLMQDEPINDEAVAYLNRLSDFLFVAARLVNARDGVPEESPTY